MPGWKRWLKPTLTRRPAARAAPSIVSIWAADEARGLLDQHVCAGLQRRDAELRETVVGDGDDDDVGA